MTRSYKKFPCVKEHPKGMKVAANRRLRRTFEPEDYTPKSDGHYRRLNDGYDVVEYRSVGSLKDPEEMYGDTQEERDDTWEKVFVRK
jgi:hypothetical protein